MPAPLKYLLCALTGVLILVLYSLVHTYPPPHSGEYYYSEFLRNNYTIVARIIFFVAGLALGYTLKPQPFFAGLCMISVFPVTTFIESLVYRGSHNLLPFELAMHLLFALPGMLGAYIGRMLYQRKMQAVKK